jgi:flagellar export protein FliJ
MPFRFQLEGLLRIRRLVEQQARQRLDESMMHVRTLERTLNQATVWSERTAQARVSSKVLPAAEMLFIESVLRQTREAIAQCQQKKAKEEQRAAELRTAYLQARRERKTIGTLRENALHEFESEEARREQDDLDEVFLGKLLHSRNSTQQANDRVIPKSNP